MTDNAILVTGAAGFIGFHVAQRLLSAGRKVVGLDSLNSYYDPKLKEGRLDILKRHSDFSFTQLDLADLRLQLALVVASPGIAACLAALVTLRIT